MDLGLTHLWENGQVPYQTLVFTSFDFCLLITPKHKHVHTHTVMMVSVTSQQGSLVVAEQGTLKVVLSVAG